MIGLLVGLAAAGGLGDLARTGEPAAVMRCETLGDFLRLADMQGQLPSHQNDGPVDLVVFSRGAERPSDLIWQVDSADPEGLATGLAEAGLGELSVEAGRMVGRSGYVPMTVAGDPTVLSVHALREQKEAGCAVAFVGASVPHMPVQLHDTVFGFSVTDWTLPLDGSVGVEPSPFVSLLLDGEGLAPAMAPSSVYQFDSAFQLHGTLAEAALALATADEQALLSVYGLMSMVPRKLRIGRGSVFALSDDKQWAVAIPFERPRKVGRVRRLLFRGLRRLDLPYAVVHDNHVRVTPLQGPPLMVGLMDGVVVVSTRDDVVQDAMAGAGQPWLPGLQQPYGLRLRVDGLGKGALMSVDGVVRFSFTLNEQRLGAAHE